MACLWRVCPRFIMTAVANYRPYRHCNRDGGDCGGLNARRATTPPLALHARATSARRRAQRSARGLVARLVGWLVGGAGARGPHRQRRPTHDDDGDRLHRLYRHHERGIITIAIAPSSFAMVQWVLDDGDDDGDGDGAGDGACLLR